MANKPTYGCTRCERLCKRELLVVKKALFVEMGEGSSTLRSRVTDWLCPTCLLSDVDYNREKFSPPRIEVQGAAS